MTIDNQPAFPIPALTLSNGVGYPTHPGMTLRDWFAGQCYPVAFERALKTSDGPMYQVAARYAYAMADAMLAERAKEQGE